MQKKTLALALMLACGGVSLNAVAQSNVQIYGAVDYGYSYRFDANALLKSGAPHAKSLGRIDSGQSTDNMIGFKGVEEIGNGTKAFFVLERLSFWIQVLMMQALTWRLMWVLKPRWVA